MSQTLEWLAVGRAAGKWWRGLQPDEMGSGGDRGALARLRRAASPGEALLQPETLKLYGAVRRLLEKPPSETQTTALATTAAVLAAVSGTGSPMTFAEMLGRTAEGRPLGDEQPLMSPARFGTLMRASDWSARFTHLRRAVQLLGGGGFNIARFADDLFWWNDRTRRRWIFEYYGQGRDAPGTEQPPGDTTA